MKTRTERADAHEIAGGDRQAYLHGCETMEAGIGMFRTMKQYPQGSQGYVSFIAGYQDESEEQKWR